jgi:hydrogenase nickel incorporation protein HypA/HybF
MHEASLVQELLRQVEQLRRRHRASRVVALSVQVGELSGVEPELLRGAYEILAPAAGVGEARLDLTTAPVEGRCAACGEVSRIERYRFVCRGCGGRDIRVLQGEALILQSVTLEAEEDLPSGFPPADASD